MKISSLLRRSHYPALALAMGLAITPAAHAEENTTILAGDGGIIQQHCGSQPQQIRIDSSSLSSFSACFALAKSTGWAAVHITGSYGVINNLTVPVNVAFKLPDGAVYWQDSVAPGEVKSVDVNNAGSTVVELHVSPVSTNNGASTADLTPGTADSPNYISLRSASPAAAGRVVRVTWDGATTTELTRNSSFLDRLDGSFLVTTGLSDPACVSLQSAAYPGMYLQATSPERFSLSPNPAPANATWCTTPAKDPVTSTRLIWAADRNKALTITTQGKLTLGPVDTAESQWFSDTALAHP